MSEIHSSRGTLNRRDISLISLSTSAVVTATPLRSQACSIMTLLMSEPTTSDPYLARHASANSASLIFVPFTIAAGFVDGSSAADSTADDSRMQLNDSRCRRTAR